MTATWGRMLWTPGRCMFWTAPSWRLSPRPNRDDCSAVIVGAGEVAADEAGALSFLQVRPGGGEPALLAVLSSIQRLLDRLRDWENRLLDLRGRGRAMREFLQVGYEIIQNPMILYDSSYLITATTPEVPHPAGGARLGRV